MTKKIKLLISTLALTLLLLTQVGATFAHNDTPLRPSEPILTSQTVPMTLNCHTLTGSAQKYAEEHNLCPTSKNATPDGTATSGCGTSTLWLFNRGSGNARFNMSATSTMGTITIVNYDTNWVNWTTTGTGNVNGTSYPFNVTWSKSRDAYTNAGDVTANMSGIATLWWGGTCAFLFPGDYEEIT